MNKLLNKIGIKAKNALKDRLNTKIKNKVLEDYLKLIKQNKNILINENKKDIKSAETKKLKENFIKRLSLNEQKINSIIKSIKTITKFKDPVDFEIEKWKRPNGLKIKKVTIPIGVIGVIYESRPNVTADVSTLCFKSGNSVILRGGSEAYFSNKILANLFRKALQKNKINKNFVQFIDNKNRKLVDFMLSKMNSYIDVIIPRGGKNLVKKVQDLSSVPVIGHLEGICHTYIDKDINLKMAKRIVVNAKLRNTSICGATETLLIHKKNSKFINDILNELTKNGCVIYADKKIKKIYKGKSKLANAKVWSTEFLSAKISVKLVNNINEAINHVNKYGTMHTDAIITKNKVSAKYFIKNVKSSIAIHNSSTQFADGGEFGFGGEVGISTNKLPPRGPVGLSQLVSYKYEVYGSGTNFPVITINDMVNAQYNLLDYFKIKKLFAVAGGSMGGMQVLQFVSNFPNKTQVAIPIACTASHSAQNIAFNELGRQAIMADSNWEIGLYEEKEKNPDKGLAVARMAAHITYLSKKGLQEKFGRKLQERDNIKFGFDADFQIESYLRYQGSVFVDRFDANSYLYITRAMDYFDLTKKFNGNLSKAFEKSKTKFFVISFTSDWLYPTSENRDIVIALNAIGADVGFVEIKSDKGHDSFLLDIPDFLNTLKNYLSSTYFNLNEKRI